MDQNFTPAPSMNGKSKTTSYLLWFFLGWFGVHRMYLGRMKSGVGMIGLFAASFVGMFAGIGALGFIGLFAWVVADAFMIHKWFKEAGMASSANAAFNAPAPASEQYAEAA